MNTNTRRISKVLIANRGEIAVRVMRACADAGYRSVAVYAEPDAGAPHALLADEAYSLDGSRPTETYLAIDKLIAVARRSEADAVHPGYGFLSENADFAQAVLDAGLIWIGPSPQTIRDLGDKIVARRIAERAQAPAVPGTTVPVADATEILQFADEHGLPVAIKAAYGGGGRGLKVARTRAEIPELFDSATRESIAAFGRGECFVERYLDKPRHVEAQVLADQHGNVIVVGTRDCSLQRRFQKLVEEAPAPFLTDEQRETIHASAKRICREADYHGAGTVEYLVGQDGVVSFLEVNTRLQVEHPVTEETSGVDLVLNQFRIAEGEVLDITQDPTPIGHAIEFRINAEDPGRNFLPVPGTVTVYDPPSGPGVRIDSGVSRGTVVGGQFDSMLAKLIVHGADRNQALARARRSLREFTLDGVATVIPFHRAVVSDPAFVGNGSFFGVHTRWIETEFDNRIEPFAAAVNGSDIAPARSTHAIEVDGRRMTLTLPADLLSTGNQPTRGLAAQPDTGSTDSAAATTGEGHLIAPMHGTVVTVAVEEGQSVAAGDLVIVLESMKMENPITAHRAGTITGLATVPGATVSPGELIAVVV